MINGVRLSEIFAAHAGPLALYGRQFEVGDADELVQETFVRLLGKSREPPNVRAWLLLTLRRLAIDRKRSWVRRLRRERARDSTAWFVPRPDDRIDARCAAELLRHLPPRQREVIVLRVWHDLTLQQIGAIVGIATSTVHAELRAGLAALRTKMETTHAR